MKFSFNLPTFANDRGQAKLLGFMVQVSLQAGCPSYHPTNSITAMKEFFS